VRTNRGVHHVASTRRALPRFAGGGAARSRWPLRHCVAGLGCHCRPIDAKCARAMMPKTAANADHRYSDMMIENMIAARSGQSRIIAAKLGTIQIFESLLPFGMKVPSGDRQIIDTILKCGRSQSRPADVSAASVKNSIETNCRGVPVKSASLSVLNNECIVSLGAQPCP